MMKTKMIKTKYIIGISLLFISTFSANASLPQDINNYFKKIHGKKTQVSIEIKTPIERWPACDNPQLQPPVGGRNSGTVSLPVTCGKKRQFIQLIVNVSGSYLVATRDIARGETINLVDLGVRRGLLHKLPAGVKSNKVEVRNGIAIRQITAGQTITQSMYRRAWAIQSGQTVLVFAGGNNFTVSQDGKAINNAATGDDIRVRLTNGQVVTGQAQENGSVKISL